MLAYPFTPHTIHYEDGVIRGYPAFSGGAPTRAEAAEQVKLTVYANIARESEQILDDVEHLAVQNALQHTTNAATLAFANVRIPAAVEPDPTLRFLIAYLHERANETDELITREVARIRETDNSNKFYFPGHSPKVTDYVERWMRRSEKIVELMAAFETNIPTLTSTGAYANAIRESARVELGELVGVRVQTGGSPARITVLGNNEVSATHDMSANFAMDVERLRGVYNATGADLSTARPATLIGKNGASLIHTYSGATYGARTKNPDHLLLESATYPLTTALMRWEITSTPIPVPQLVRQRFNLTLAAGVTESVDLTSFFSGTRLTITAASSDTTAATVQVNEKMTSMGVLAVSAGYANVTITATNESGTAVGSFGVSVS